MTDEKITDVVVLLKCMEMGTITIVESIDIWSNVADYSGSHASYHVRSASGLLRIVRKFKRVQRHNGEIMESKDYTEEMARKDFDELV